MFRVWSVLEVTQRVQPTCITKTYPVLAGQVDPTVQVSLRTGTAAATALEDQLRVRVGVATAVPDVHNVAGRDVGAQSFVGFDLGEGQGQIHSEQHFLLLRHHPQQEQRAQVHPHLESG